MGNIVTLVQSYRLNKEYRDEQIKKKRKKNICNYLYGKCRIKDVQISFKTNPLLRET